MGERSRAVVWITSDFRRYHELAPFLQEHGVMVEAIAPGAEIPTTARVVIDGPPDARRIPLDDDDEAVLLRIFQAWEKKPNPRDGRFTRVVIGIDPGDTFGVAVVADNMFLLGVECPDVDQVAQRISAWQAVLAGAAIHIGDGVPRAKLALTRALRPLGLPIWQVPEHHTTPRRAVSGSRHIDAAVHIATRSPEMDS